MRTKVIISALLFILIVFVLVALMQMNDSIDEEFLNRKKIKNISLMRKFVSGPNVKTISNAFKKAQNDIEKKIEDIDE